MLAGILKAKVTLSSLLTAFLWLALCGLVFGIDLGSTPRVTFLAVVALRISIAFAAVGALANKSLTGFLIGLGVFAVLAVIDSCFVPVFPYAHLHFR
jgi:hypothetical protein